MNQFTFLSKDFSTPESTALFKILLPQSSLQPADFENLNWDLFLHLAECHRITTYIYHGNKVLPFLPTDVLERLKKSSKGNQIKMIGFMHSLLTIITVFRKNGIAAIPLKGPVQSYLYLADYTHRLSQDLDILVHPCNLDQACLLLENQGFIQSDKPWTTPKQKAVYIQFYHHYSFYHPDTSVHIELHWKLHPSEIVDKVMNEDIWVNIQSQLIAGVEVKLLSKNMNFLHLCIHGGGHRWRRIFWIQDIASILEKEEAGFVEEVYSLAIHYNVGKYFLEACLLANLIFGVKPPEKILHVINKEKQLLPLSEISFLAMQFVAQTNTSFMNKKNLVFTMKKIRRFYLLGGVKGILHTFQRFLISPECWKVYSFNDRFFVLNYIAAPFLRLYTLFTTYEVH